MCLALKCSFTTDLKLALQEVNTEERVAPLSPTKSCGDLLSITSSKGGLKAEVATILGAQQFFHESGAPRRSVFCHV